MEKDKEKSALENFLGEFGNNEEKNPFEENTEDPFNTGEEAVGEQTEEKEEKPLPFNKDPKVQKFIEKEISKRLADVQVTQPAIQPTETNDKVTDVLTRLIGNDTPEKVSMINEFKSILTEGTQKAKQEAIAELESRENAQVQAQREAEVELENAFETIEETYDVDISSNSPNAKKTRQEFISFVERIAPKDRNGEIVDYPDMTSAWEAYTELKKATQQPSRAKELAARSMTRSTEAVSTPQKRVTFNDADDYIQSIGK